jgi:hypothetical protein
VTCRFGSRLPTTFPSNSVGCFGSNDFRNRLFGPPNTFVSVPGRVATRVRAVSRAHGAPQHGQTPRSLVPALTHGSTRAGGKVAKWAPLYGRVVIVQTLRRLRVAYSFGRSYFRWHTFRPLAPARLWSRLPNRAPPVLPLAGSATATPSK